VSEDRGRTRWPWLARWLHTYVSLLGFGALLFFSVTGITLNHAEYFEREATHEDAQGTLPKELVSAADAEPDTTRIATFFRTRHALHGALAEFRADADELSLVWKGPAYAAEALVQRASGDYELSITTQHGTALIDDLHKGRDSGPAWSLLIDASAIVMILASLTGLWLLFYVQKRKHAGLLVALVGCLALLLVWALLVP